MPLTRLEIENFKSYSGRQIIGPFSRLTAIIGPNGAGKSNLMDAISFVMGIKAKDLRGSQLKDLINRDHKRLGCSVTAFYLPEDAEDETMEIAFTRSVSPKGASEYRVNGKVVTFDNYSEKLKSFGLNIKAKNFLVFQGDVENIASMSPKQLTEMFEQISGSDAYKQDYEQAAREAKKLEDELARVNRRQKDVMAEKRQYKAQKEEAEKYKKLLNELEQLRTQFLLWELYQTQQEMDARETDLENMVKSYRKLERLRDACEKQYSSKKKERARAKKDLDLVRRGVDKKQAELNKLEPKRIHVEEEIKQADKSLQDAEARLKDADQKRLTIENELKEAQSDLESIIRAREEFERQIAEEAKKNALDLNPAQMNEFQTLQANAKITHGRLYNQVDELKRHQERIRGSIDEEEMNRTEMKQKLDDLEKVSQRATDEQTKTEQAMARFQDQYNQAKKEIKEIARALKQAEERSEQIKKDTTECMAKLDEARARRKETSREKKKAEAYKKLKANFKEALLGRVSDLCQPKSEKYHIALAAAFGGKMDNIVVDTLKTGEKCLRYLRDQKLGTMSFIPLDSIKYQPPRPSLRNLSQASVLLSDVLTYDERVEPAIMYCCANTMLCPTDSEAKKLVFGHAGTSHRRAAAMDTQPDDLDDDEDTTSQGLVKRAVTLDGTIIRANGVMEGGKASYADRAKVWQRSDQDVEQYTNKLTLLQNQMKEVTSAKLEKQRDALKTKEAEAHDTDKRLRQFEFTLSQNQGTLKNAEAEKAECMKKLKEYEANIAAHQKELKTVQAKLDKATTKLDKELDKFFAPFCQSLGVSSYREFEKSHLDRVIETMDKRKQLDQQITSLEADVEYRKKSLADINTAAFKEAIKQAQKKKKELKSKAKNIEKDIESIRAEIEEKKAEQEVAAQTEQTLSAELEELAATKRKNAKELTETHGKIRDFESEIEQLVSQRHAHLKKCKVDDIAIPFISGSMETVDKVIASAEQDQETGTTSGVLSSDPDSFSTEGLIKIKQREAEIEIDFDDVPDEHRDIFQPDQVAAIRRQYEKDIQTLHAHLEDMAPNLKVYDRLDAVSARAKETSDEHSAVAQRKQEAQDRFEDIRQLRRDVFMEAFSHIESKIGEIYTAITKGSTTFGGSAYLTLENNEEPYLAGIKFSAIPPTKQFRDMDQLSGGEKTVAALALLFAIHSFQPAPFFVLDEIDAALDNVNVNRIFRYMASKTSGETPFQCIVISLKDTFFSRVDSLVGIYRDRSENCSKTVAVDLTKYPVNDVPATQQGQTQTQ